MKTPVVLRFFGFVGLAVLASACNQYDPNSPDTDTTTLVGMWAIDNNNIRQPEDVPVMKRLQIHATHMEYSAGNGSVGLQGKWRDDGFWYQKPDGSGEAEAAKIVSPVEIEVHLSAFYPLNPEVDVLYKVRGSDAEMQAMAAKYPPPITFPPPPGVIQFGMTEYELTNLPWKADSVSPTGDEPYSRGTLYTYHSDNPKVDPLQVTVKNRRVVLVRGGN